MTQYKEGDEVTFRITRNMAEWVTVGAGSCYGRIIAHKPAPEPQELYFRVSDAGASFKFGYFIGAEYKVTITEGQEPKIERV